MALKKPPTAHPANGGGGSDSESEEEPPMKGMMQGAQFFFIDANGWFGDGGWTKMRGKKTIWKKVVSGSFVGCLLEFSPKNQYGIRYFLPKCPDLYQVFRNSRKKCSRQTDYYDLKCLRLASSVQIFFHFGSNFNEEILGFFGMSTGMHPSMSEPWDLGDFPLCQV